MTIRSSGRFARGRELESKRTFSNRAAEQLTVDRHVTGATDRYAHLVVAFDAVEVLLDFACVRVQFQAAAGTVEVIWMIWLVLVFQRFRIVDYGFALETDILSKRLGLQPIVAVMTDRSIAVLDEALIC